MKRDAIVPQQAHLAPDDDGEKRPMTTRLKSVFWNILLSCFAATLAQGCSDDGSSDSSAAGGLATISERPMLDLDGEGGCDPSCAAPQVCVDGQCATPAPVANPSPEMMTGTMGEQSEEDAPSIPTIPVPSGDMPSDPDPAEMTANNSDTCVTEEERAQGETCSGNEECSTCLNGLVFCNLMDPSPGCVACIGDGDCAPGQSCMENSCRSPTVEATPLPAPSAANGFCDVECAQSATGRAIPEFTNDGICQDGGPQDLGYFECQMGTDCFDCPPRPGINTGSGGGDCPDTYIQGEVQCTSASDCAPCGMARPFCDSNQGYCVECRGINDCALGEICDISGSGLCVPE